MAEKPAASAVTAQKQATTTDTLAKPSSQSPKSPTSTSASTSTSTSTSASASSLVNRSFISLNQIRPHHSSPSSFSSPAQRGAVGAIGSAAAQNNLNTPKPRPPFSGISSAHPFSYGFAQSRSSLGVSERKHASNAQQVPHQTQQNKQHLLTNLHHQQIPSSQQLKQHQHPQRHFKTPQQLSSQQQRQPASLSELSQNHHALSFQQKDLQSGPQQKQLPLAMYDRLNIPVLVQSAVHSGTSTLVSKDNIAAGNHIVNKRSIHELFAQIDASEKFDSEVEEVLLDIADDFVESITTYACSLAKHRNSTTLEAKDILLHVERNWNIMVPGFGGDNIKPYKKQLTDDIMKGRLALIKKAADGTSDTGNS